MILKRTRRITPLLDFPYPLLRKGGNGQFNNKPSKNMKRNIEIDDTLDDCVTEAAAVYCYIESKVHEWYQAEAKDIFEDWKEKRDAAAIKEA